MFTTTISALPSPSSVATLLTGIIGRPACVSEGDCLDLDCPGPTCFAIYRDDMGTPQFAVVYDLALAANAVAALRLLPPSWAVEGAATGFLTDELREDVHEVLNIQARLFNGFASGHIHLSEVIGAINGIPERLRRLMPHPIDRVDFEVRIKGYGEGVMSIVRLCDPMARLDDQPFALAAEGLC